MGKIFRIYVLGVIIILISSAFIVITIGTEQKNTKPVMYGSNSCPHCIYQKKLINSSEYTYIECNNGIKNKQSEACIKAGIVVYPTWIFPNNIRIEGVITEKQFREYNYGK